MHCLPLDSCLLLSSSAGHSLGVHAGPDSDCACSRKFLHLFHMLNQSTHSYKSLFHPQGSEQGADSAGGGRCVSPITVGNEHISTKRGDTSVT